jgi:hypothetical protein
MELTRSKIIEKLEELEEDAWQQGFAGSNERELFYKESIADYILNLLNLK